MRSAPWRQPQDPCALERRGLVGSADLLRMQQRSGFSKERVRQDEHTDQRNVHWLVVAHRVRALRLATALLLEGCSLCASEPLRCTCMMNRSQCHDTRSRSCLPVFCCNE